MKKYKFLKLILTNKKFTDIMQKSRGESVNPDKLGLRFFYFFKQEDIGILATRIIAAGFLFAGGNIAIQGVFQALGCGLSSLVVSVLRLFVVVLPLAWIFTKFSNATFLIWFAFPIAEAVALLAAVIFMKQANSKIGRNQAVI